ncbi:MAG: tetratricopeptide repeat protein [Planctomycetota bacterium]|jgi:tetratricopeptide (TPR) repeat protein
MRPTLLVLLAGVALAGPADDLIFRARHAQQVQGDLPEAIRLYREALGDTSLSRERQAEIHLRIALCYKELKDYRQALDHLTPHMYKGAPPPLGRLAGETRRQVEELLPKEAQDAPRPLDQGALRRELFAEHLRQARRFRDTGDEVRALWHIQWALKLDPSHGEARALHAELETRLSGLAHFVRDPLEFVRTWTETRVTQVARTAENHLQHAVDYAARRKFNLAVASFEQAVAVIDACEFGRDSDRLVVLRHRIVARWEALLRDQLGGNRPEIPEATRSKRLLGEFLNAMQSMLDLISDPDREYRIVPVRAPRRQATSGWRRKPLDYVLLRDLPSSWSPADFARLYLPRRVHAESWSQRGNYVEAVGSMLVARNRPPVLDALQEEIKRLEQPPGEPLRGRFLLVPVRRDTLKRFQEEFGEFQTSHRGREPVQYRVLPARVSLDYLCSYLRDEGIEARPDHDTFEVDIANGVPQTFFAGVPLNRAPGYETFKPGKAPPELAHFGVVIDLYALRDRSGATAAGFRLTSKLPVRPLSGSDASSPRFLGQEAALFVDLPRGTTLAVAGLVDPFAPGDGTSRELLLLWEHAAPSGATENVTAGDAALGAEVSLRNLLLKQRDDPGPRRDERDGFTDRGTLDALSARARFLETFLQRELESDKVKVQVEEALLRVPPALREDAAQVVAALERESRNSYIVRVHTRAVRTSILERWLEREHLKLTRLDELDVVLADAPSGEFLLRNLEPAEPGDVFAPRWEWPKPAALGLQARHLLSTRTRTSPAYARDDNLATAHTRKISEGLRVTVRPFTWRGNTLRIHVDIETAALESEVEERALALAVPSYRTKVAGTRVTGTIDVGNPARPQTALVCRIPHPTASRPGRLTEIVIALSVRRVP